jgi:3-hydroxyacyl-[acyl-carrier-protein] dehydratase
VLNMQHQDNQINASLQIATVHDILNGHFPEQPVVPGVCMMEISKEIIQTALGCSLMLQKAAQVKFLQLLLPAAHSTIQLKIQYTALAQAENTILQSTILWENDNKAIFKMMANYLSLN